MQEGRRRRQAAPRPGAARGALEFGGDVLVRPGRGLRAMPAATVRVELRIGRFGERAVGGSAFGRGRAPVDGRAHQRVKERHAPARRQQLRLHRRRGRAGSDAEPLARAPQQRRVAERVGGGDQHQQARVGGKRFQALAEARLDPARERRAGQDEAARELRRRQPAGKFEQRERVAACLVDDALAHLLVERASDDGVQQRLRVAPTQAFDDQLRQALEGVVGLTCGQDQAQRFREQPARDERQRLQRRAIEPLGVVDDTHQRAFAGHVGEQAQDRQPDEEAIGWRARHQPERRAQRVPLRPRQPLETIEHRRAQLVQAAEGELHLGVDPGGPGHAPFGCPLQRVLEERRLPDPRLAAQHEHTAVPGPYAFEHTIDARTLVPAPAQHELVARV